MATARYKLVVWPSYRLLEIAVRGADALARCQALAAAAEKTGTGSAIVDCTGQPIEPVWRGCDSHWGVVVASRGQGTCDPEVFMSLEPIRHREDCELIARRDPTAVAELDEILLARHDRARRKLAACEGRIANALHW